MNGLLQPPLSPIENEKREKRRYRLLRATELAWPTDWAQVLGLGDSVQCPLILEIGFGYGHYLWHLSRLHPEAHIIGLEIANACLERVEARLLKGEMPNVSVIFSKAETALHHLFEPHTLSAIHINFPDPWFKNRHGHRRLMQRDTLDAMVSRLQTGGRLYLATDIREYAEMSADLLANTPGLTNSLDAPYVHTLPKRTITKYEARAHQEGRICHYFVYERNQHPAPVIPVIKDHPMPHIVIRSPLTLAQMQAQFQPSQVSKGDLHVHYMAIYSGSRSLLFETFVDEPTIEQHVGLVLLERENAQGAIAPRADGLHEYTLRLGTIGSPRPTDGMHLAVRHLSAWLLSLSPEATIVQAKLRPTKDEA